MVCSVVLAYSTHICTISVANVSVINPSGPDVSVIGATDPHMNDLMRRIRGAVQSSSTLYGAAHYSLRRNFETAYDPGMRGFVSIYDVQSVLNQLGVALTAVDLQLLRSRFDRTGNGSFDYVGLCSLVEGEPQTTNVNDFVNKIVTTLTNERRKGTDVRFVFVMHDTRDSGFVSILQFHEAIRQLGIPLTEAQIQALCSRFAQAGNPNMISYEEFLEFVGRAAQPLMSTGFGTDSIFDRLRTARTHTSLNHDVIFDPRNSTQDHAANIATSSKKSAVAEWYKVASPKLRREYREVNNSITRFREVEDDEILGSVLHSRDCERPSARGWRTDAVELI